MVKTMNEDAFVGLIAAFQQPGAEELRGMGTEIGKLKTSGGFPIDMALSRLDMTKLQKVAVLEGALSWLVEHCRNSGASDKAIDRQRSANSRAMERFIETGEAGIY
jgi:hypothetical protein